VSYYYINGMRIGGERSGSPQYGHARQQMRRVIYNWLTKVVGWSHVDDESGDPSTSWATPEIGGSGGISDGVSDATDGEKFISATGGFSALTPATKRYFLLVTGFSDSTRDGFYLVDRVVSDNEIRLQAEYSLHTDGLPLNETGLTWWVFDFYSWATRPGKTGNTTWWVIEGTGVGGAFHLRCQNNTSVAYMKDQFDISPFDDWDNVAHSWKTPARHTAVFGDQTGRFADSGLLFGVADSDKHTAVFWLRQYEYDLQTGQSYPIVYYFGDLVPFRPTDDTRPVVGIADTCGVDWKFDGDVNQIADDYTQIAARALYVSQQQAVGTSVHDGNRRVRSYHSGRVFRVPWIVATEDSTHEEIRGYLKDLLMQGHAYGDRQGTPFGTSRDMIRLGGDVTMRFNGSRQYYYIF